MTPRRTARWVVLAALVAVVGCRTTPTAEVFRGQSPKPDPFPALVIPVGEGRDVSPPVCLPTAGTDALTSGPSPERLLPSVFDPPVDEPSVMTARGSAPEPLPPLALPPVVVEPPPDDTQRVGHRRHAPARESLSISGCSTCGGAGGGCNQCEPMPQTGFATRLVGLMYETLCCPDPCYRPKWIPLADSAFFTESARPVSHTRLRWEYGHEARLMDRAEYFWARSDGNGKGLRPNGAPGIPRLDYHEISQYTETAAGPGFSAFVSTPYRSVNPTFSDPPSAAGFGDISLGTKSVLFDSELFLLTLQFKTTLPVGQPAKGLGTGHVSLEPSLLFGLRTSPNSYLQGQIAEWIPLGGDPTYSGALLHYHLAYNHTLWQPIQAVQLVGTFEVHGWSFQDGGFTHPDGTFRPASGFTQVQMGPGVRLFFCDKYDFGVGTNFGVSGLNSVQDTYRFEMRVRF